MTTDTPEDKATGRYGVFIVGGQVRQVGADTAALGQVRDHLGSLLQVQNLVLLIGSGASFHLGSPRTRALATPDIIQLVEGAGRALTDDAQDLLKLLNQDDNADLETLLDRLQTLLAFADKFKQPEVALGGAAVQRTAINELRTGLNRSLAQACRLPGASLIYTDPLAAHRTLLSRVARARRPNLPRPKIFTTNYDLAIEKALDELGFPYIDGFSGTVDRRLNLAYYGIDHHRVDVSTQRVLERSETSFYVHKVHGSVNWRAGGTEGGTAPVPAVQVRQVAEDDSGDDVVLIYPTATKEGDTLAYPYADLLRLLDGTLQQPDTAVLSLGYGYQDDHINRIVLGALAMNSSLHLTIADPFGVFDAPLGAELEAAATAALWTEAPSGPVGRLARSADSRVAVVTGPAARFADFVELLPDPGMRQDAPNQLAELVMELTKPVPERGEGR